MACNFPRIYNGVLCPCGKCAGCLKNMRQVWCTRLVLESYCHPANTNFFLTLTYADEHYPSDGCVNKRDLQLFMKRLRKRCGSVRFFGVGEYGKKTLRAHYHLIVFGFTGTRNDIESAWGCGFVYVGDVNPASITYVCKYVSKMHDKAWRDTVKAKGLQPEFKLMSRRPGIGFGFIERICDSLARAKLVFVPSVIRIGGRIFVLGRYLRSKIFSLLGITDEQKKERVAQLKKELLDMFSDFSHFTLSPESFARMMDYDDFKANYVWPFLESLSNPARDLVVKQQNEIVGKL